MSNSSYFQRVKKLGEGGFGLVYLVLDNRDNHYYVSKEIDLNKLDSKAKKDALKEVEFLSKLNHPNIVSYKEYFETHSNNTNILYIIMQYCDNGDLEHKVKQQAQLKRPFSEIQVLDWFVQLCLALKHIHDRKILHRDLKTQNVFLMKNLTLKLGDFGIAKNLNSTMEHAKTQIGTPYYLVSFLANQISSLFKSSLLTDGF
jgi:NIMA (never in mitosis gene a)-related kinase